MKMLENARNFTILQDEEENIYFFSYKTLIATYNKKANFMELHESLENKDIFTQTTTKQFYYFIDNYTDLYIEDHTKKSIDKLVQSYEILTVDRFNIIY